MSALTSPKGPLPARVYWVRRFLLLATVFLLVFATSRLIGGEEPAQQAAQTTATQGQGAEGTQPTDAAEGAAEVAADGAAETGPGGEAGATPDPEPTPEPTPEPPPLPEPSGPCEAADVLVTPSVAEAIAADGLTVDLEFRTKVSEACTWEVSPETVTAKITSGPDDIWSSQQCPAAIPAGEIVVRNVEGTVLPLVWNLRRSDADCSRRTDWARLGWYHVSTATLGGEPASAQFELARPPQDVVKEKSGKQATKNKQAKKKNKNKKSRNGRDQREFRAGDGGDGTAEPNG